jgi:hypothetical protein
MKLYFEKLLPWITFLEVKLLFKKYAQLSLRQVIDTCQIVLNSTLTYLNIGMKDVRKISNMENNGIHAQI